MTTYQLPYIFSSSEDSGASNISSLGSTFEVVLESPIVIPKNVKYCYLTVESATAWWNVNNITDDNNKLEVTYDDGILSVTELLVLSNGLYDLDHLNQALTELFVGVSFPSDLFTLVPDTATQKISIKFNYTQTIIDFTVANSIREVLGFDSRNVPLLETTTTPQYEKADNIANLTDIEYYLLHSDIISRGILINNTYSNVIAQMLINVPPGEQLISQPLLPPKIPANELIGDSRKQLKFWLTDQDNNLLDTKSELFSCRIVINYVLEKKNYDEMVYRELVKLNKMLSLRR